MLDAGHSPSPRLGAQKAVPPAIAASMKAFKSEVGA